ncbi:MAG: FlgD immunoglobulin-like domain containing protein [Candidatus Cloacimonetes bacterium]|nr:FlgD immunoglobulin-like domain containing protein [Candidatus Cloacimonadota bacterium]
MRNPKLKLLFLLAILLSLQMLCANAVWDLVLDSVSSTNIEMRLHAYNPEQSAWDFVFPYTNWYHFLVDDVMPHITHIPNPTEFIIGPYEHYYFPMTYNSSSPMNSGMHTVQAIAFPSAQQVPTPVGQPRVFYLPVNQYDAVDWSLVLREASQDELSMYLCMENPDSQILTFSYEHNPFYSYKLDGEFYFPEPLEGESVYNLGANEFRHNPLLVHPLPLSAGMHSLQIYINSAAGEPLLPVGEELSFNVTEQTDINFGSGETLARVPLDFTWRNNLYQCVLSPQDFAYHGGEIKALSFYSNFLTFQGPPVLVRIFMKHTDDNDLAAGWIPVLEEDLVFYGVKSFANGLDEQQKFWLQKPFDYDGVSNVAIMVERVWTAMPYNSNERFKAQSCPQYKARMAVSNNIHYDPYNLPASHDVQLIAQMPKMTVHFDSNTMDIGENVETPAPDGIALKAYPNPFVHTLELEIELAKNTEIKLDIYNLRGQKQKSFVAGSLARGKHSFRWDGRDAQGNKVPAGIYLCRAQIAGKVEVIKLVKM